jgi:hypothetical protein
VLNPTDVTQVISGKICLRLVHAENLSSLSEEFFNNKIMEQKFVSFEDRRDKILNEYVLIPHTRSSRLYSTVRRMKAEKELAVPFDQRNGFVISTGTGLRTNEMAKKEWEGFYEALSNELKTDYPDIYARLFDPMEKFCNRCAGKARDHYRGGWMACGWSGAYKNHEII